MKKNQFVIYLAISLALVTCTMSPNQNKIKIRAYINGMDSLIQVPASLYPDLLQKEYNENDFKGIELKRFESKPEGKPGYVLQWQMMNSMLSWGDQMAYVYVYSKKGASVSLKVPPSKQRELYKAFENNFEEAIFSARFCSFPKHYGPYAVRIIPRSSIGGTIDTKNYYSNSRKYAIAIAVKNKNMVFYFTNSQLDEVISLLGQKSLELKIKEALNTEPSFLELWGL